MLEHPAQPNRSGRRRNVNDRRNGVNAEDGDGEEPDFNIGRTDGQRLILGSLLLPGEFLHFFSTCALM